MPKTKVFFSSPRDSRRAARSSGLVQSYAILYLLMFGFSVQVLINTQLQYPVIKELMPNDEDDKPAADSQFTVDEEADVSALGYTPLPRDEKKPGADTPRTGK